MSNMVILKGPQGVRLVNCGEPYRLLPEEQVIGSASLVDAAKHKVELTIGAGDFLAKILKETGFQAWWNKGHRGQCLPCKQRQAVANYLQFKGPAWLKTWVDSAKE